MSYTVEVVDNCGEDYGPSSDERVVAVVCLWINRKGYRTKGAVAHEKLEERRVSTPLLRDGTAQMLYHFGSVGSYGGYGASNMAFRRIDRT